MNLLQWRMSHHADETTLQGSSIDRDGFEKLLHAEPVDGVLPDVLKRRSDIGIFDGQHIGGLPDDDFNRRNARNIRAADFPCNNRSSTATAVRPICSLPIRMLDNGGCEISHSNSSLSTPRIARSARHAQAALSRGLHQFGSPQIVGGEESERPGQ